jgi:hypothetical protein
LKCSTENEKKKKKKTSYSYNKKSVNKNNFKFQVIAGMFMKPEKKQAASSTYLLLVSCLDYSPILNM